MTADAHADADAGTARPAPEARAGRRGRAPFELLRFTATPVPGALVVAELEGRFAQSGRFARGPVLVVEPGEDRPRLELAPVRTAVADGRWRAAYAIPAETFETARFALGLRGTLLDLPAPDEPDDAERVTALAREANALRRRLEAAEADVVTAHAETSASAAELGAAVLAARDQAVGESSGRIAALEQELVEARTATDAAEARATAAEARVQEAVEAVEAGGDQHERRRAADAEARALAAEEGTAVLRAELAEERERSQATITELEEDRAAAVARLEALRRAAEADAPATADAARIADLEEQLAAATARVEALRRAADPDQTQVLAAVEADDDTRPLPVTAEGDRVSHTGRRERVLEPGPPDPRPHPPAQRSAGAWLAVAALVLFAFVLLGLLLGFLA
jgi:hypothetical protein